jgi:colanic acid/amylovoran biosynthesis glycosyltransferase
MKRVAVYRHQLFKLSETFIHAQTRYLSQFAPIFAGREIIGDVPAGSETHIVVKSRRPADRIAGWRHSLFADPEPLVRPLKTCGVSLIHAHFGVEGVFALKLARRLGVPLVTTFHGFDATINTRALVKSGKPGWIRYGLQRKRLAAEGARFICVSRHIQKKVLALGFPPDKTVLHYIGVDTQNIRRTSEAAPGQRIIHVARLTEKKGTRYLLDAFAIAAAALPAAELLIIGDGPLRSDLERQTADLGLSMRVKFMGAQPRRIVLEEMENSSVFCLPSVTSASGDTEGLPIVLLEAAALELPAVTTLHGGIGEAVIEGETGFLVAERDVAALAERLVRLLNDDDLRSRMGKNARQNVVQNFDLSEQTAKLEEIYASCL